MKILTQTLLVLCCMKRIDRDALSLKLLLEISPIFCNISLILRVLLSVVYLWELDIVGMYLLI